MAKLADQNISMYQGDDFSLLITISDTEEISGLADLSAFTSITWALSKSDHGSAVLSKTAGAAEITVVGDPLDGVVNVVLLPEDTLTKSGVFRHEMQLVDGDGKTHTVLVGKFTILPTIIKD